MPAVPLATLSVDALTVQIYRSPADVALAGSEIASKILREAVEARQRANAIFATGRSQIQFLNHLTSLDNPLPWQDITGFHLDEYLGLSRTHPASFRYYLAEHLTRRVALAQWHGIEGDAEQPLKVCETYAELLRQFPADLCCLGIGNNGHLAFNDPSVADFSDRHSVKLVRLDEKNRQQQVESNSFKALSDVPQYAFTLTLTAIQQAKNALCLAYGKGKAGIVSQLLGGAIDTRCPASILRKMNQAMLLLDSDAASQLSMALPEMALPETALPKMALPEIEPTP